MPLLFFALGRSAAGDAAKFSSTENALAICTRAKNIAAAVAVLFHTVNIHYIYIMSKQKSYVITDAADQMAAELAGANGLTKSAIIEVLIRQAHDCGWSVSKPITQGVKRTRDNASLDTIIGPKEARYALRYHVWTTAFAGWYKRGLPNPYTLGDVLAMHEKLHPKKAHAREGAIDRLRQYINASPKERADMEDIMFVEVRMRK